MASQKSRQPWQQHHLFTSTHSTPKLPSDITELRTPGGDCLCHCFLQSRLSSRYQWKHLPQNVYYTEIQVAAIKLSKQETTCLSKFCANTLIHLRRIQSCLASILYKLHQMTDRSYRHIASRRVHHYFNRGLSVGMVLKQAILYRLSLAQAKGIAHDAEKLLA